jgi:hypothetical protein
MLLPATAVVYFIMALPLWREMPLEEVYRIIITGLNFIDNSVELVSKISNVEISKA